MDYAIARKCAFRLLSLRSYHSAVLKRKLGEKGCSEAVCEQVIAECKRLGFLNDDEAVLREFRKGKGPRAIEYKLHLKRQEVQRVITREMQRQKIKEMAPKLGAKERAVRFLQRRGFDLDLVIEIFSFQEIE